MPRSSGRVALSPIVELGHLTISGIRRSQPAERSGIAAVRASFPRCDRAPRPRHTSARLKAAQATSAPQSGRRRRNGQLAYPYTSST